MPPIPELIMAAALILGPSTPSGLPAPHSPPKRSATRELTVPLAELRTVLMVAGEELDTLVQRSENHGALAVHRNRQSETLVEWSTLRVSGVHDVGLREEDRQLGINRRYLCRIRAMQHRVRPSDQAPWSDWRKGSHPAFPDFVEVIREQGRWRAIINNRTGFSPPAVAPPR